MMDLPRYARWPLATLLVAHGTIHILGFLWALDLADFDEIGPATLLVSDGVPGAPAVVAFGLLWLVSMVALISAGIGVARETTWGLKLAGVAAGISLVPTIVWWDDAWIGALLSAAILATIVNTRSLTLSPVSPIKAGVKSSSATSPHRDRGEAT